MGEETSPPRLCLHQAGAAEAGGEGGFGGGRLIDKDCPMFNTKLLSQAVPVSWLGLRTCVEVHIHVAVDRSWALACHASVADEAAGQSQRHVPARDTQR